MRQHQVPLPCAQEIAALRRKRVQPSFSDCKEAGAGQISNTRLPTEDARSEYLFGEV